MAAFAVAMTLYARFARTRGIPSAPGAITIELLDPQAFDARLAAAEETTSDVRCRRLAMEDLGLLQGSSGTDPRHSLAGYLRTSTVTAAYLRGTDTIFTIERSGPTIRHEWIHAVEDQLQDRLDRQASAPTTDESIALRAAIEGTASHFTQSGPSTLFFSPDLDVTALTISYIAGPAYVALVAPTIEEAFSLLPHSVAQVLFPDSAQAWGHIVAPVSTPALCVDRLGPAGILTAAVGSGMPQPEALKLAARWTGDLVWRGVREPGGVPVTEWYVRFADADASHAWQLGPAARLGLASVRATFTTLSPSTAAGGS